MNQTLEKTLLSFHEGILSVSFFENAVVEVEDVVYIYCYGLQESKGKPYGVLFDSSSKHEFTEEAIVYFASSSHLNNVIAIAYISKDLLSKIRLSLFLIFEKPPIKPKAFTNEPQAWQWLKQEVACKVKTQLVEQNQPAPVQNTYLSK